MPLIARHSLSMPRWAMPKACPEHASLGHAWGMPSRLGMNYACPNLPEAWLGFIEACLRHALFFVWEWPTALHYRCVDGLGLDLQICWSAAISGTSEHNYDKSPLFIPSSISFQIIVPEQIKFALLHSCWSWLKMANSFLSFPSIQFIRNFALNTEK